ncbi:major tail protein [Bacillus gobiensis]|uniref:major tail protein n=1 Tax=Bacillus gobiensis TaxID=1441095 RepID=UPI003D1A20B7
MPRIGFKNLYVAKVLKDSRTELSYETPVYLGDTIEGNLNPNFSRTPYYANDTLKKVYTSMGQGEITLGLGELSDEMSALLFGHKINTDGILEKKESDVAPEFAVLFETPVGDGDSKYVVITKATFTPGEQSMSTKGEGIEPQTDSVTGSFVPREFDGKWQVSADTRDETTDPTVFTNWFTKVYGQPTP